jgi:hypothetical protein
MQKDQILARRSRASNNNALLIYRQNYANAY